MPPPELARCRVVLVRPHYAGNVGSVARAMANFGLSDLVLVDPIADPTHLDAVMMATHGLPVLKAARTVPTLAAAVADCVWTVATSGETGGLTRKGFWGTPAEQTPGILSALHRGPVALVFGPEPSGLTVAEIGACHAMTFIPTDAGCPSMNLAASVAVCGYELRKQWLDTSTTPVVGTDPPASREAVGRMFAHLREGLIAVRFLWDFRADGIFHVLKTAIARGLPSQKELDVFHGLAQQLRYVGKTYGVPNPRDDQSSDPRHGVRDRRKDETGPPTGE